MEHGKTAMVRVQAIVLVCASGLNEVRAQGSPQKAASGCLAWKKGKTMKLKRNALVVGLSCALVLALVGVAFGYTASIKKVYLSGSGVCMDIEICWDPSFEAPPGPGMTADGTEHDWPDPDDSIGTATNPTPATAVYVDPNNATRLCQVWTFCFPDHDCEWGDEEYSAIVHVNGQNVPTGVTAVDLC